MAMGHLALPGRTLNPSTLHPGLPLWKDGSLCAVLPELGDMMDWGPCWGKEQSVKMPAGHRASEGLPTETGLSASFAPRTQLCVWGR